MTDPLGQSQVLPYLKGLSTAGYRITLVSFEKKQRYAKEGAIIQQLCSEAGIQWKPLFFTKNPPILSKIYDRWQMRNKAIALHRKEQFDLIHCRSYISAEMGLLLKRRFGVKFLFDMRGFWADEKVDGGQWDQHKLFFRKVYQHYKRKEREFLLEADGIISLTEMAKQEMLRQPDYRHLKIDVIPCCADLELFDYTRVNEDDKASLRKELKISTGARVITYLGSVGGWYMTKEMFSFVRSLLDKNPDFVMLVLTKDEPAWVREEAAGQGIPPEKLIITTAPRNKMPLYISLSDCSIFFIKPTYSKKASSPTKHAELMGMGVPVVCNDIGDTGHIIGETGTGVIVEHFSKMDYEQKVRGLDQILSIPKASIRAASFRYFDLATGIDRYREVYKRLLKE